MNSFIHLQTYIMILQFLAMAVYILYPSRQELRPEVFPRQNLFTEKPEPFTRKEQREYLASLKGVALGSDAFFPFGDNIERAARSGVSYIAQPGGSIRDDNVIEACNNHGMVMAMTGMRLFHH